MKLITCLTLVLLLQFSVPVFAQKGEFLSVDQLHQLAFSDRDSSEWQTLWVSPEQRRDIEKILGHSFPALRIRYWGEGSKTVWIFEEIGKELPIQVGIIIDSRQIQSLHVMTFRESRGGEVRYPFFTSQFQGAQLLNESSNLELDRDIDGLTGATLSVNALTRLARLALYCHDQTSFAEMGTP